MTRGAGPAGAVTTSVVLALAGCPRGETAWSSASKVPDAAPNEAAPLASEVLDADVRDAAPADVSAAGSSITAAPVLDPDRGRRASADYLAYHRSLCKSLEGSATDAKKRLQGVGLYPSDQPMTDLCSTSAAQPIATGSFFRGGADEVLLQVRSGGDDAWGENTLALMRLGSGGHYQLVHHYFHAGTWTAHLRVQVPGSPDVLLLCARYGRQGLYPSQCGFLGQGWFATAAEGDAGAANDGTGFDLVLVRVCGPQRWVALGDVTLQGTRIAVQLVIVSAVLGPNPPGSMGYCFDEKKRHEKRFTIVFEVTPAKDVSSGRALVKTVTPPPSEVTKVSDSF